MIDWLRIQLVVVIFHISNIKEFHAKSHNQFSSLLLKSSSKSTFHHKILPGTGDDVTSIERLVTY